ncbi:MAG TPA: DUF1318 domain-containing protein [bacterium]|nr:DUF1318 domain-containing protein [bacterium]
MLTRKRLMPVLLILASLCSSLPAAWAEANYDIKQMTPAIQQALHNRQDRYANLQSLKAQGILGEDNQGFVAALKSSPEASSMALAENNDRLVIYQAIVDQNQLGQAGLAKVKQVFAEVQREKARRGDYVQLASGEWTQK